jgi:hypothetical protein
MPHPGTSVPGRVHESRPVLPIPRHGRDFDMRLRHRRRRWRRGALVLLSVPILAAHDRRQLRGARHGRRYVRLRQHLMHVRIRSGRSTDPLDLRHLSGDRARFGARRPRPELRLDEPRLLVRQCQLHVQHAPERRPATELELHRRVPPRASDPRNGLCGRLPNTLLVFTRGCRLRLLRGRMVL